MMQVKGRKSLALTGLTEEQVARLSGAGGRMAVLLSALPYGERRQARCELVQQVGVLVVGGANSRCAYEADSVVLVEVQRIAALIAPAFRSVRREQYVPLWRYFTAAVDGPLADIEVTAERTIANWTRG